MKKYISVLLAVFVFVMGMIITNSVNAASKTIDAVDPKFFFGTSAFEVKIDGTKNFKLASTGEDAKYYTGTVEKGKSIKIHGIINPVPLETVNAKEKKTKTKYTNRTLAASIKTQSLKDNKIVKELTKTFTGTSDSIMDNTVDFKVPKDITHVCITIKMSDKLSGKESSSNLDSAHVVVLTVVNGSTTVSANNKNSDKLSNGNSADDGSGGIGFLELGGGAVLIMIGGYIGMHFIGGSVGGAAVPEPEPVPEPDPPAPPPEPEYFTYKDPAGFETLYMKDPETGQWYNYQDYEEGYRVPVDMDKLQEYDAQRREDVKWNRDQMEKLENRETGLDKELKQEYQDMLEREKQIQQETKKDLYALQRGTFGMSNEERKTFLEDRQAKDQEDVDKWTKRGETWDKITKTAEVVQKAADMGVDALAVATAPVGGQLIADVYTGAKNIGGNVMDAAVNHKNVWGAALKGAAQAGADIVQGHVAPGAKWTEKLGKYVASESLKEGIVAAVDGENAVKAALKGVLQGACKWGIEAAGDMVKGDYTQRAKNTMTQRVKQVKNMPGKSDISQKSLNELEALQYRRFIKREQELMVKQGLGQTITKETTSAIGDMAIKNKSFSEAEFGEKW